MNSRLLLLAPLAASTLWAQVSFDRILGANKEPQNWLTYSGTTFSQRYSLLNQVTPANVKNLDLQWVYQVRSLEKFEATPLVVDGIMYTVEAPNTIIALDAASGGSFGSTRMRRRPMRAPVAAASIAE
jgi:alcohol dehydrogenase (cytochrome c)